MLERIEAAKARPLPVRIVVDKGRPYRIARIGLRAETPAEQPALDQAAATPSASRSATRPGRSRCWQRSARCSTGC
ncbi:hypothetical protein [Dankookia sp. P2]|uniref:hypothetical protein n=1 Tax=Dankookia sp. P2 TaxID=3423955 RepID=UPI003D672FF9